MKKIATFLFLLAAISIFSDNIPQRVANNQLAWFAATGNGSTTNPFVQSVDLSASGPLNVNVQDQTTRPIGFYFSEILIPPTTTAALTAVEDKSVTLTSTAGCNVGDYFALFSGDRYFFAEITSLPGGNVVDVDTPLDFAFPIGSTAACFSRDLNVDGSISTRVFTVEVGGSGTSSIDITRLNFLLETATAPELSDFGDIAGGLAEGLVIRRVDGVTENIETIKNNGQFAIVAGGDLVPFDTGGIFGGVEGFTVRSTFSGQEKRGVAIRLNPGDELQILVQDDLSSLLQFQVVAQGHVVED